MFLKDLLTYVKGEIKGDINITINDVAYDSRRVKQGTLFVAIKGFKSDGHDYIKQALENGASAVIVEKEIEDLKIPVIKVKNSREALALVSKVYYNNPSSKLKLIGVTGTNGKTTTTYLIKSILEQCGKKTGLIGTNQNMIGDVVLPTERTTPESFELQGLFADMVKSGVEYVIMEVSSHSLELNRVDGCEFDVGIFTNLTQDHLDFHITMENYLKAKTKLFSKSKFGVVNIDDESSKYILENGKCKMLTFGINNQADVMAKDVKVSEKGVQFTVKAQGNIKPQSNLKFQSVEERILLRIPGLFTVYNALGSIAACMALGISIENIKAGLISAKGVQGRAQLVNTNKDFTVLIDYAHTPDGLENIIKTVKDFAKRRVITVFGCGGDRDRTKRPIMGKIASELSDFCVVTSDNPRTEDPLEIINEIVKGMDSSSKGKYKIIENRLEAIKYAIQNAQKDDIIILAGKGHETYQEIQGVKYHFNEEEIVQDLLMEH